VGKRNRGMELGRTGVASKKLVCFRKVHAKIKDLDLSSIHNFKGDI